MLEDRQNCVGTPDQEVTRYRSVQLEVGAGSQRPAGGNTSVVPNRAPVHEAAVRCPRCGRTVSRRSPPVARAQQGVRRRRRASRPLVRTHCSVPIMIMLRCEGSHPGRPVVPLVNRIMNGSSSSRSTSGSASVVVERGNLLQSSSSSTTGAAGAAPAPVRRSSRGRSPNTTTGFVSSMPYSSSGPVHHPLRPTTIPPRHVTAHCVSVYGRLFDSRTLHGRPCRLHTLRRARVRSPQCAPVPRQR